MKLFLLRHGQADWPEWNRPDDERPLTEKGKTEMERIAEFLKDRAIKPGLILSSPLPRAWQTAEIAAKALEVELRLEPLLKPGFSVSELKSILQRERSESLMLVGHEPDFSTVIRTLTGGEVKMAKAGLARVDLEHSETSGRLLWLLPPRL